MSATCLMGGAERRLLAGMGTVIGAAVQEGKVLHERGLIWREKDFRF